MTTTKKIFWLILPICLILLLSHSKQAFSDTAPLWNKGITKAGFAIYKILIVCGGEYGFLCRKFENPKGNVDTPKTIHLDNTAKNNHTQNYTSTQNTLQTVVPAFAVESDIPKNKMMAERYFDFIRKRAKVTEYLNRMKLN